MLRETNLNLKKLNSSLDIKYSQDFIDVAEIANGLILCNDGSIVKILELVPINYSEKKDYEKDAIADIFGYSFKSFPKNGQIKIMDSKANLDSFIQKIKEASKRETNPLYKERLNDYIENTIKLQKYNATRKRFFFIFSYEGDASGKKSEVFEEIYTEMSMQTSLIYNAFSQIGNLVINADDDDFYQAEILYSFFNPKSFEKEGLNRRIDAVSNYKKKHFPLDTNLFAPTVDYLAPRGISFKKYDSVLMDGIYHTYLALRDSSFPLRCNAEWVRTFINLSSDCDIDIHFRRLDSTYYSVVTERTSVILSGVAIRQTGDDKKQNESLEIASNAQYINDLMTKNDEDLYEVSLMITLRADSFKELQVKRALFIKQAKSYSFYFDECFLLTKEYLKMAMPLNKYVPEVFNQNRRNMTNSSLSSLYCITAYEMFNPNGYCMGLCSNSSLFSFDPFDTKLFPNPHIFLAGTTGAGKSYTENMLSSRMRLSGVRTIYLLPLKGYEYRDAVISLGGSFIPLVPGGKACINIMEIREEANAKDIVLYDDDDDSGLVSSLLAKKITSILSFISLLIGENIPYDVEGLLNVALTNVYSKFGITNDNKSIYLDDGSIKKMPILEDLYNEIKDDGKLARITDALKAWVKGNCSNMNGETNVNLDNLTIAFDIDEDKIGEKLLPAFMYIAFDMANSLAKRDLNEKCAIIFDEVWKLLLVPSCASQVFKAIKILRAFNCSCISATQDIEDCTDNAYGRSIITLSAIQIFLKCQKKELEQLERAVDFSEDDKLTLMSMHTGEGYICFNTERIKVNFLSSLLEEALYNPAPAKKREKWLKYLDSCKNPGEALRIWNKILSPLGITSSTYF